MTPLALTPLDLAFGLLAATLLGVVAGYLLRLWQERRSGAEAASVTPRSSSLDARASRQPGLRATPPPGGGSADRWAPGLGFGAGDDERPAQRPPAQPADPWRHETPVDVQAASRDGGASGRPTVLVVDDRMELRAVHSAYLRQHGYRVITAADGDQALQMVRKHNPAVLVLDHSLPGRTGIEVTRELKSDPRTARIPVILMTAHSYGAIGMAARQAGVDVFLPKPVDPSRVLREVERHAQADVRDA